MINVCLVEETVLFIPHGEYHQLVVSAIICDSGNVGLILVISFIIIIIYFICHH